MKRGDGKKKKKILLLSTLRLTQPIGLCAVEEDAFLLIIADGSQKAVFCMKRQT